MSELVDFLKFCHRQVRETHTKITPIEVNGYTIVSDRVIFVIAQRVGIIKEALSWDKVVLESDKSVLGFFYRLDARKTFSSGEKKWKTFTKEQLILHECLFDTPESCQVCKGTNIAAESNHIDGLKLNSVYLSKLAEHSALMSKHISNNNEFAAFKLEIDGVQIYCLLAQMKC